MKTNKVKQVLALVTAVSLQSGALSTAMAKADWSFLKKHAGEVAIGVVGAIALPTTAVVVYKNLKGDSKDKKTNLDIIDDKGKNKEPEITDKAYQDMIQKLNQKNSKLKKEKTKNEVLNILNKNKKPTKCWKNAFEENEGNAYKVVALFEKKISKTELEQNLKDMDLTDECVTQVMSYYKDMKLDNKEDSESSSDKKTYSEIVKDLEDKNKKLKIDKFKSMIWNILNKNKKCTKLWKNAFKENEGKAGRIIDLFEEEIDRGDLEQKLHNMQLTDSCISEIMICYNIYNK